MGCNCGNKKNYEYIYVDSKGKQTTYTDEVSARAAKIRDGHKGVIRTVQKTK